MVTSSARNASQSTARKSRRRKLPDDACDFCGNSVMLIRSRLISKGRNGEKDKYKRENLCAECVLKEEEGKLDYAGVDNV